MFDNLIKIWGGLGIVAEGFIDSLFSLILIGGLFYISYLLIKGYCQKKK